MKQLLDCRSISNIYYCHLLRHLSFQEAKNSANLLQFAGAIPAADLGVMEATIRSGCENIDEDGCR